MDPCGMGGTGQAPDLDPREFAVSRWPRAWSALHRHVLCPWCAANEATQVHAGGQVQSAPACGVLPKCQVIPRKDADSSG